MKICLSFGDSIVFSSFISSFCNSLECYTVRNVFENLVILSAILLPIKSPRASAIFELLFSKQFYIAYAYGVDVSALSRSL